MAFSIRLTEQEKKIADSYARLHSISLGEAFKQALFEKIEEEYDLAVFDDAYDEYKKSGEESRHMSYVVRTTPRFEKEFKKLDRYTMKMIKAWIEKNLSGCENPRVKGKALTANRKGQWRYRIGDYRLLCLIEDEELVILALSIGHRREVYDNT